MFLKTRHRLINWLAGEDIPVIINCKVYDYVLKANWDTSDNVLYERNDVISLDVAIQNEVAQRINLDKQGIRKQGSAFILK